MRDFLAFLANLNGHHEDDAQLPSLKALSQLLGQSVPRVREHLAVARALGLVEAKPRVGLRRLPYSFRPAASLSLHYALCRDRRYFAQFADLRKRIEAAYFVEAVHALTPEDKQELQDLLARAWEKLRGDPIHIPHEEHRHLHLTIFRRLDNVFVRGLLEAYWDAYEAVGLNLYTDYQYLHKVWEYHQRIVDGICSGDVEDAHQALVEHTELIRYQPNVA